MGAVRRKVGGIHLGKECLDLPVCERVFAPYHAMAGNAGQDIFHSIGNGTIRSNCLEFLQGISQHPDVILIGQKPWHSLDDPGGAAELIEIEPHSTQFFSVLFQFGSFTVRKLKGIREKKALPLDTSGRELQLEALEGNPLVGRMLIDDNQIASILAKDVGSLKLADDCQSREISAGYRCCRRFRNRLGRSRY